MYPTVDPAVAAANRVMEADWESSPDVWVMVAREALLPVREALAEAVQVAYTGATGTPPDLEGVSPERAFNIMVDALVAVRPLIYAPGDDW